jgi:hypothetical protein
LAAALAQMVALRQQQQQNQGGRQQPDEELMAAAGAEQIRQKEREVAAELLAQQQQQQQQQQSAAAATNAQYSHQNMPPNCSSLANATQLQIIQQLTQIRAAQQQQQQLGLPMLSICLSSPTFLLGFSPVEQLFANITIHNISTHKHKHKWQWEWVEWNESIVGQLPSSLAPTTSLSCFSFCFVCPS